jgi:hypothetical protein
MSTLNVDKVDPSTGTALEIGSSGDTVTVPSGATFAVSGTMNASSITAGTIATARLGSGTASSSTVLYGDQTYKAEPGGGKILQVVQTTSASSTAHSTVETFTASNISGAITPTAASSKILVNFWYLASVYVNGTSQAAGTCKLYQDIDGGGYAALWPASVGTVAFQIRKTTDALESTLRAYQNITYLDSPSYTLTDVITYKLYAAAGPTNYGAITTSPDSTSASVILTEIAA